MHSSSTPLPPSLIIRPEAPGDAAAIHRINALAFGQPGEADLVDRLRREARPFRSLVACRGDEPVGHVCFSPVTIGDRPAEAFALAPMAVLPELQRQGIGSALVRAGLEACRDAGAGLVVLIGHPGFYPRFGFAPARPLGLTCPYEVPDDVFLVAELRPGAVRAHPGLVRFHPAFEGL